MRWILIGAAGALSIGGMAAAPQARLPAECRQEIVALCPMGGGLRDCLRTALPKVSAPCRAAISDRADGRSEMPTGMREVAFGADPKQRMDLAKPAGFAKAPVLIYLKAARVPLRAVSGVILLDGAGYNVPAQIKAPGNLVGPMYDAAFGTDVTRQKALSPTLHAAAPNVANWLILPIERRADSQAQSNALAAGLRAAGASTRVVAVPGESHSSLNKGLGEAGDFATAEVDRFLKALR